jgi:glucose/mannose transport system substrate-binding protein
VSVETVDEARRAVRHVAKAKAGFPMVMVVADGHEGHRSPTIAGRDGRLAVLVDQNRAALRRYLLRGGVAAADLDDAAQEALFVVASRLADLPLGSERAYLFATAQRVAMNARRGLRRKERVAARLADLPQEAVPQADAMTDQRSARALLDHALAELPPEGRVVFLLAELEEMTVPRIAARLGLREGTVASRLRRARQKLGEWAARSAATAAFEQARSDAPRAESRRRAASPCDAEILSWWVSRGESEALGALLSVYERSHPHTSVVNAAVSGTPIARRELRTRMSRGRPPDTFQVNGGTDLFAWVGSGTFHARMEPLDFLFSSEGWTQAFPPDVLELVTHAGRAYAVPVDIHRINTLFYNRSIFAEAGLSPPTTLDELYAAAEVFQARGVVPFGMGYRDPWTLTLLAFENVMVAVAGGDYYRDFFSGKGSPDDPELRATLAHAARILDYTNPDAASLGWDDAVELVGGGGAAMTIMGDWAKGYLSSRGEPLDFGEVPAPGAAGAFVFATDAFGLPRRAAERPATLDLLKVMGSREGQDAFNPLKGSIPARTDADLSFYDPIARATARDFWSSPRYPSMASLAPSIFTQVLDAAMGAFARTRDPALVVGAIRAHYDLLSPLERRPPFW